MVKIGALDISIIVRYFILMIAIGIWSRRKIHNMDDYYIGGRRFGKFLMIMFGFGLGSHADTAVGVAAQSYKIGMAGIWYRMPYSTPLRLIAMTRSQSAMSTSPAGADAPPMPALFTA